MRRGNPNIGQHAREGAKASARARKRLTLDRVLEELGPLETVEDAMRRLDRIGIWITAGLLSGAAGGASVRALEVWLRGHESKLTERVVEDLKGDLARLKRELKGRPPLSVTR